MKRLALTLAGAVLALPALAACNTYSGDSHYHSHSHSHVHVVHHTTVVHRYHGTTSRRGKR